MFTTELHSINKRLCNLCLSYIAGSMYIIGSVHCWVNVCCQYSLADSCSACVPPPLLWFVSISTGNHQMDLCCCTVRTAAAAAAARRVRGGHISVTTEWRQAAGPLYYSKYHDTDNNHNIASACFKPWWFMSLTLTLVNISVAMLLVVVLPAYDSDNHNWIELNKQASLNWWLSILLDVCSDYSGAFVYHCFGLSLIF